MSRAAQSFRSCKFIPSHQLNRGGNGWLERMRRDVFGQKTLLIEGESSRDEERLFAIARF